MEFTKKLVVNSTNYVRNPEISVEYNDGIGETVPDSALTLEELIERFVQGRDVSITPVLTVPESFDQIETEFDVTLHKLATMSKLEKAEFAHELGHTIDQTRTNLSNLVEMAKTKTLNDEEARQQDITPTAKTDEAQPPSN